MDYLVWIACFVIAGVSLGDADNETLLATLQDEYGNWELEESPEFATSVGINKYNDRVELYDVSRFATRKANVQSLINRLSSVDYDTLTDKNKVDYDIFKDMLQTYLNGSKYTDYSPLNAVNFLEGPQIDLDRYHEQMPFDTLGDFYNYLQRLRKFPTKIWMRCEPHGYTHDYRIYMGRFDEMQGQTLGERVVKHLSKELKYKGHHVFFDRFFTSIPLVQCLETYGIYACGTIKANRRGFPAELKNPPLERGEAEQLQHGNMVATVWNDNKPIDGILERLRRAVQKGHTDHNVSVTPVPRQIRGILKNNTEKSAFYKPFISTLQNNSNIDAQTKENLRNESKEAIQEIIAKYRELEAYLKNDYFQHLRASLGVNPWDNGKFYRQCLRWHLSLDLSPEDVHARGLSEVKRIYSLMKQVMKRKGHNGTVKEFFEKLRNDSKFFLHTQEEVLQKFNHIIHDEIEPKLPLLFKDLPNLPVVVKPNPNDGPGGQYIQGPADGSRPGTFLVNAKRPDEMITIDFMALALHETNPGHHLQLSTAATSDIPTYRKFTDGPLFTVPLQSPAYTAYIEGWALYAESLGEEMGLYADDYQLIGRYGSEIFRACRLVVDTGLHFYNWSREEAIEYMLNYTAYGEKEITTEIDRYVTWPGQACAYKIGELKIRELRSKAESELGERFDIKDFHSVVLRNGAMPLSILDKVVNKWITDTKKAVPTTKNCDYTSSGSSTSIGHLHVFINCVLMALHIVNVKQRFS